ncbi:MAG: DUF4019 domain-containing protein [Erythrobacter sp.]
MRSGYEALTEREKATLRLILRGHDAKSSARELGISVHTVNERLRDARRKLSATSSREAARRLMAAENLSPELMGDKQLGDAGSTDVLSGDGSAATGRQVKRGFALILAGGTMMSLLLATLLLPASPLAMLFQSAPDQATTRTEAAEAASAARAAETWLKLVDDQRWAESWAATGSQFRQLNTLERWTEVSQRVRQPLGAVIERVPIGNEFVPAPPQGYRLVKFQTSFANRADQVESVSLVLEEGRWKVVGITIE